MVAGCSAADGVAMIHRSRVGVVACALALAACRAPDTPVSDDEMLAAFGPALEIGRTTREDALLMFGAPAERFEDDRILCWRVFRDGAIGRPVSLYVSPWYASPPTVAWLYTDLDPRVRIEPGTVRSVVLVFDGSGVLRKARALRQP
jgi:hypothetical protein